MKRILAVVGIGSLTTVAFVLAVQKAPPPSNGIAYPANWKNWPVVSVSYRTDNHTIRAIIGNETAVEAIRTGKTRPWPDGTILGKIVWKDTTLAHWKRAVTPGRFVHVEFMLKDSKKYASTYGWGWARWLGTEQKPFTKGPQTCISCHTPVRDSDWVFTRPAPLP